MREMWKRATDWPRNEAVAEAMTEEQKAFIKNQLLSELNAVEAGESVDNAILLQSLAGNWSIEHFLQVAKYHGQGWRTLTPLVQKVLEIQGLAMVYFVAVAAGNDLVYAAVQKTISSVMKLKKKGEQYANCPFATQIISDGIEASMQWNTQVSASFRSSVADKLDRT